MFVMTAKLSKPRLIAAGVLILAVVILVVALVSGGGGGSADAPDGARALPISRASAGA